MSVRQLTSANMAMNRKRTAATIISMGLSCVLFIVAANFTGNVSTRYDARKQVPYGQFQIDLMYSIDDAAYPENNLDAILKNDPLDEKLVDEISNLEGVTDVQVRYMMYTRDQNGNLQSVGVMNREQFEDEKYQGPLKGTVDYDQASENGEILYGWSYFIEDTGYDLGDTVTMTVGDAGGETQFRGIMSGAFGSTNYDWVITDQTYEQLGLSGKSIGTIWVDCDDQDCGTVRSGLEELLADKQHYELSSYEGALETSESTLGSVLVSLIVGMPAGYALFCYGRQNGFFGLDVYHVPVAEITAMILILAVLQISLSYILIRNVKRESIVERIRYQE